MLITLIKTIVSFCMLIIFLQACKKDCKSLNRSYRFINKVNLHIRSFDTINIGDTIKFISTIPFLQTDSRSGSIVNIQNGSFKNHSLYISNIQTFNNVNDVISNGLEGFNLLNSKGTHTVFLNTGLKCNYQKFDSGFVFSLNIVPLRRGLTMLRLAGMEGDLPQECSNFLIGNQYNVSNLNHQFFLNLTGGTAEQASLTDSDFFIWVK